MLCQFQYSKVSQLYIHIHSFFQIISPYRPLQYIKQSSLFSRSLLVIYFIYWVGQKVHLDFSIASNGNPQMNILAKPIYSTVYMSIPISQFIPPITLPPGNHKFVFYTCNSIFVLQISLFGKRSIFSEDIPKCRDKQPASSVVTLDIYVQSIGSQNAVYENSGSP